MLTEDLERVRAFARTFAPSSEVVIHRYSPSRAVGGALGALNFRQDRLIELIELGFHDAVYHDCAANGCVL